MALRKNNQKDYEKWFANPNVDVLGEPKNT